MELTGGCYCRKLRYRIDKEPRMKAMCLCRECQHVAGGGPNVIMSVPEEGFTYTQGEPRSFARSDLAEPASREFCGECGTHILTRSPRAPGFALVKVGSLDDPSAFGMPAIAVHAGEKQAYHCIPEGVRVFEAMIGGG